MIIENASSQFNQVETFQHCCLKKYINDDLVIEVIAY